MNEIIKNEEIKNMIYTIRGKQVMLDKDLAILYNCKNGTKTINLTVKRHINRFPERFMFQLTEEEINDVCLRFQSETLNSKGNMRGQHIKYSPYVFTEQGVAMLATVLRTDIAEEVSIRIMDAFVAMRHYYGVNDNRLSNIESKVLEHDNKIKMIQDTFDSFIEKKRDTEIYFDGQTFDAYAKVFQILSMAKKNIIIVDNYADITLLDLIKNLTVNVSIITKPKQYIKKKDVEIYNSEYNNLNIYFDDTFHDRFFIIDNNDLFYCGASLNSIGKKTFTISIINENDVKDLLIKRVNEIIKK